MLWLRTFPPVSRHWVTRHYSRLVGLHSKLVSQACHLAPYSFPDHYLPEDLCSYNLINIKVWNILSSISWKDFHLIFLNEYDIPFFLKAFKGLDGTTLGLISSSSYSYWTYSSTTSSISTRRYFALEHPIMTRNPRALIRIVTCFILDWCQQLRFRIKICFSYFMVFNFRGDTIGMNCHHRLSGSFIEQNKRPRCANLRVTLSLFNPNDWSMFRVLASFCNWRSP